MLDVADGRSRRRWVVQVKLQDLVQVDVGGVLVLEIPHHFLELVEVKVLGPVLQEVEAQLGEQQVHDVLAQDQVGVDGGHGRHSVHGWSKFVCGVLGKGAGAFLLRTLGRSYVQLYEYTVQWIHGCLPSHLTFLSLQLSQALVTLRLFWSDGRMA